MSILLRLPCKRSERKSGFTLVEVLLVTAIFASIGVAVFTCLSNGLRLWTRTQRLVVEEDATVLFERLGGDLRNAFLYSRIPFEGDMGQLAFPTVVYTPADRMSSRAREGYVEQVGMVRYFLDSSSGRVLRAQANYSQATRGSGGPAIVMVNGVKDFRLRYFYAGSLEPSMTVHDSSSLPVGVEVELSFSDKVLKRYLPIPAGS
ncbi:MAG: prepilin-type N-terminal cleavage/methylation domain-containing protein [Candidatus Omnitrophica bacterium]|nr:prepilin-type N-terminal cleavage/methylation domain-containing protein [Candidatus Omnitrophota bacterium]